jgi:acyl-CoA thioester hydrolase
MPPALAPTEDAPLSGRIVQGVHILPVRVHWEDTDAGGIVYHASHLRFMERGRSEMLRVLGIDQVALRADHGINYVVTRIEIDYLLPGQLDMALRVETGAQRVGRARLDLRQTIRHGDAILSDAIVRLAAIGGDGRPRRAPDTVHAAFAPMLK